MGGRLLVPLLPIFAPVGRRRLLGEGFRQACGGMFPLTKNLGAPLWRSCGPINSCTANCLLLIQSFR